VIAARFEGSRGVMVRFGGVMVSLSETLSGVRLSG
jgi:hypothetical protein